MKKVKYKVLGSEKSKTLRLFGEPFRNMDDAIAFVGTVGSPRLELTQETESGGERSWDNF